MSSPKRADPIACRLLQGGSKGGHRLLQMRRLALSLAKPQECETEESLRLGPDDAVRARRGRSSKAARKAAIASSDGPSPPRVRPAAVGQGQACLALLPNPSDVRSAEPAPTPAYREQSNRRAHHCRQTRLPASEACGLLCHQPPSLVPVERHRERGGITEVAGRIAIAQRERRDACALFSDPAAANECSLAFSARGKAATRSMFAASSSLARATVKSASPESFWACCRNAAISGSSPDRASICRRNAA